MARVRAPGAGSIVPKFRIRVPKDSRQHAEASEDPRRTPPSLQLTIAVSYLPEKGKTVLTAEESRGAILRLGH